MASRKLFAGIAGGLASRFIGRNFDVGGYWGIGVVSKTLHDAGLREVTFDLLDETTPGQLGTARFIGEDSRVWLTRQLAHNAIPRAWLASARMNFAFTPRDEEPSEEMWPVWVDKPAGVPMFRALATAILTDDLGRERAASRFTWCWDHDPLREGKRHVPFPTNWALES